MVNSWMCQPDTLGISGIWVKFQLMKILLLIWKKKPSQEQTTCYEAQQITGIRQVLELLTIYFIPDHMKIYNLFLHIWQVDTNIKRPRYLYGLDENLWYSATQASDV